jgi:Na+/H+ antiporter NhaD/arsenite permease-like protein
MELENPDLSWKSHVSLVLFLISLIFVIRPLNVPLPASLQNRRWVPSIALDCATAPLLACLLLLALQCTRGRDIRLGIVGTPDGLKPYTIIILFFALAYLCVSLDVTGFLRYIAYKAVNTTKTNSGMFRAVYALAAVLTVFTSNDIVVLTLTPLITYMAAAKRVDPLPHLMAQFHAANSWSTFLYIGNPTNIILCQAFSISFMQYSAWMSLPSVLSNLTAFGIIFLLFRPSSERVSISDDNRGRPVHPTADEVMAKALGSLPARHESSPATFRTADRMPPASAYMSLQENKHDSSSVEINLVSAQSDGQGCADPKTSSVTSAQGLEGYAVQDKCGAAFASFVLVACIVALLLTSITPIPVWAATLPFAVVVFLRDAVHDLLLWHSVPSSKSHNPAEEASQTNGLAIPISQRPPSPKVHRPAAQQEYIVPAVAARLPWTVAPFVVCTFILVETLQSTGWVAIVGNFVHSLGHLGSLPAILIVGFLSIAAISLCNNQPITILIAKILLHATLTAGRGPKNLESKDLALVFGCIVASNFGALLTLNGALAGLMWIKMLNDHKVRLSIGNFMWVGALVTVPAFVVALVALWIETLVVG